MTILRAGRSEVNRKQRSEVRGQKSDHGLSVFCRLSSGFTLIELLITLVIVGFIMGLVIGQMGRTFSWDLKSSSRKLSSTIRYLYQKAASEGITLRLVVDLDDHSYKVEGTSEQFTLTKEEEEAFSKKKDKNEDKDRDRDKNAGGRIKPKEAAFSPQESYLLKSVRLPRGVYFKDVYAEHQIGALSSGKAYIYFFPQGVVERSVIHLRDANDDVSFSLIVNPISGSVKIESGYKELELER